MTCSWKICNQVCWLYLCNFYLDVQVSTGGIQALDGKVGAVIFGGNFFITSANTDYIPLPPFGNHEVKLRADSLYGDNDPMQWAQPYIIEQCHLAAIPHPNTSLDHRIIWWTPTIGDYSLPPRSRPVSGVGKLCQPRYNELRTSVIFSKIMSKSTNNPLHIEVLPLSNHLSSGFNKSLNNCILCKCRFIILNLLSETCRGYGSRSGPSSTTWRYINLAWMVILLQAM